MAIIKHIASKNADYTEAERYLTFQHDESTGKPILDEDGYMIPREKYLIEGIECEPSTFARECNKANKQFGKNRRKEDVKSHHYILSFDPKDRELGLTMEQAQKLGMEFAKEHFPGHQALVCTHEEGHNESGNIHVHIVINSLRIHDTEELPYQQRPCDTKVGYKHHCSNSYLSYLQDEVMKMCQNHGLNQVNLKGSEQRITDAEYHAKQQGQRTLDKENAEKISRGEKPAQTTFETEKEKIRRAILDTIEHSADENEFKKKLYEMYGIKVKESRGCWSYLPSGRERPITGKKLGDAFEKVAVINAILGIENGTFDHSEQKSGMDKKEPVIAGIYTDITGTESIGRVIDIKNSEKAKASTGYEYWAKLHNLQEQSKTLNYLTENGLLDGEKLDKDLAELTVIYQQCRADIKETEAELKSVNRQLRLLGQFYKTKKIYREYAKGGKKKDFFVQHQSDIELYEAATKDLKEIYGDAKLPAVQMLKERKAELTEKKQKQYEDFKGVRLQWMELSKLAQNRDSMLGQDKQNTIGNKKTII